MKIVILTLVGWVPNNFKTCTSRPHTFAGIIVLLKVTFLLVPLLSENEVIIKT